MDNNESPTFDRRSKKIRRKDQEAIKRLAQELQNVKNDSQSSSDFTQENFYDKEYRLGVDLDLPEIFNLKPFKLVTTRDIAKGEIIVSGFPLLDRKFVEEHHVLRNLVNGSNFFASKVYVGTGNKKFIPNLYVDERTTGSSAFQYVSSLKVMFASIDAERSNSELKNAIYKVKRDQINHIAVDLVASQNLEQGHEVVVSPFFQYGKEINGVLGCAFTDAKNLKQTSKFGLNNVNLQNYNFKTNKQSEKKIYYLADQLEKGTNYTDDKVKIIDATSPRLASLKASSVGYIVKYIV